MGELQGTFVANMKRFRKEAGVSQTVFAESCGLSANYIAQIEMGRRIPSFENIEKIANSLSIEPYQLFINKNENDYGSTMKEEREETIEDYLKNMSKSTKKQLETLLSDKIAKNVKLTISSLLKKTE
jgi:transcriptional regulator with XRE-family HTH domain